MSPVLHNIERMVEDLFRQTLFTAAHDPIDKFGNEGIMIFGVRQYLSFPHFSFSGHNSSFFLLFLSFGREVFLLGFFGSVLRAALFPVLNAYCIQGPTDDVIPNTWKVFHPSTPNEDNRMLLKVVADPWNIRGHFDSIGQSHSGNFSKGGIRFLGSGGIDSYTNSPLLRRSHESWG
jgi:hypothetical protein